MTYTQTENWFHEATYTWLSCSFAYASQKVKASQV